MRARAPNLQTREARLFVASFMALFAASLAWAWGFTVDDALISTRVAHQLAQGHGYRFNPGGPLSDAVTPFGWAFLLAPFAAPSPIAGLAAARYLGLGFALVSAYQIAKLSYGRRWQRRLIVLAPAALCLPLGAWCVSGMETPLILLLATLSLTQDRRFWVPAGLAAALRPEMVPWAMALALTRPAGTPKLRLLRLAAVLAPPLLVALLRAWLFGSPAPLSAIAKPADLSHGVYYAVGALQLLGVPLLWVSCRGLRAIGPHRRSILWATLAHWLAVAAAGGDWMALFRLFVPVIGGMFIVAAHINQRTRWPWLLTRVALCCAACLFLNATQSRAARGIYAQRLALIAGAKPLLSGMHHIATLDAGWVGAASDAEIVDLAGVTDRSVAYLPGGHTSKQLPPDFLLLRDVDGLVLLLGPGESVGDNWRHAQYARLVELRVARLYGAEEFVVRGELTLQNTQQRYVILERAALARARR